MGNPDDSVALGLNTADSVLEHYGIKGMKWGVRRKRGANGLVEVSEDARRAREILSGSAKAASNQEIQAALNRMKLESDFKKMQLAVIPQSRLTRGTNWAKKLLSDIGNEQATRVAKGAASIAVEQALKSGGKVKLDKKFSAEVGKRIVPKKK